MRMVAQAMAVSERVEKSEWSREILRMYINQRELIKRQYNIPPS